MIQVIAGKKGSGKTKRLIDLTNGTTPSSLRHNRRKIMHVNFPKRPFIRRSGADIINA